MCIYHCSDIIFIFETIKVDKNGFYSKMSSKWTGTIIKEHLIFASRITKRVPLVEQVLLNLPEHPSSHWVVCSCCSIVNFKCTV